MNIRLPSKRCRLDDQNIEFTENFSIIFENSTLVGVTFLKSTESVPSLEKEFTFSPII